MVLPTTRAALWGGRAHAQESGSAGSCREVRHNVEAVKRSPPEGEWPWGTLYDNRVGWRVRSLRVGGEMTRLRPV